MSLLLLAGYILVIGMVSSIPLFTNGILQKMLTEDLENYQHEHGEFPGYYRVRSNFSFLEKDEIINSYKNLRQNVHNRLVIEIPLAVLSESEEVMISIYDAERQIKKSDYELSQQLKLCTRPDLEAHITLVQGRMYTPAITDDTLEVIVSDGFLNKNEAYLNDIFELNTSEKEKFSKLKIVGVFTITGSRDTYWRSFSNNDKCFVPYQLFTREFIDKNIPAIRNVEWNFALDYHRITITNSARIISRLKSHYEMASQYRSFLNIDFITKDVLESYTKREKQLRLTLWIIEVPVFILLFFYVFMISNLIVANEQNEISVLKSRGKSSGQIFAMYLLQSLLLGITAFLAGPPLGLAICKLMGASNGFLEFVRRTPLSVSLTSSAYIYSGITLLFLVITTLIPTTVSARISIVQAKQLKNRDMQKPVWKRFFIDLLLLLVSGYGFYRYFSQQKIMEITGTSGTEIGIDPVLFLTSTLFILGAGLFFLRFFPLLIRGLFRLGRKIWPPGMYCALLQISRTGKKGQFLMLFLIFSIAIGIFEANMARTLNRNIEDKTRYRIGADITLQQEWQEDLSEILEDPDGPISRPLEVIASSVHYREPPFTPFTQIKGIEQATKVFEQENGKIMCNNKILTNVKIQGIIPNEFGQVAWFRQSLLPHHWYNYLNLLSDAENAFLVSSNVKNQAEVKPGDTISITWGDQNYLSGIVYALVDYWPAFNRFNADNYSDQKYLVVANLHYLHNKLAKDPYQVWLKKREGAADQEIYESLEEKNLVIEKLNNTSQELVRQKNDPLLKGINGSLTQGFILIMLVCITGFLIFWMLSLKSRTLQFGILRAMGLSRQNVVLIILYEQFLMSGSAIFIGLLIGGISSVLFVPFLQLVFSAADQVPPFRVVALNSDYLKIYVIIAAMMLTGFFTLSLFLRHLKIGSALKLGED